VAARVGTSTLTVRRWRRRYAQAGVEGLLKDATRPPGRQPLSTAVIQRVLHLTLHEKPPRATHWSVRSMAAAVGLSHTSVQRIWHAHGLKPHLVKTFKLSTDKHFVEKVQDVVGLYLDPRTKPWFSQSMKSRRSRRSTAPSRACRSRRAALAR
jgi:transposase